MTYFIAGILLVILHFFYRALSRPLAVSIVKTKAGRERVFLSTQRDEVELAVPPDSYPELSASDTLFIGQIEGIDIEAPDGMMFVSPGSSEFMNSPFSLSNFVEIFLGDSYHGLKLMKVRGTMASISYRGLIRLVDLSGGPIFSIDGIIIRVFPFSPDDGDVTGISIEGLLFHSKVSRSSFGLRVIEPKTSFEPLSFSKVELMDMVKI